MDYYTQGYICTVVQLVLLLLVMRPVSHFLKVHYLDFNHNALLLGIGFNISVGGFNFIIMIKLWLMHKWATSDFIQVFSHTHALT